MGNHFLKASAAALIILSASATANADVILSTDFTGRTVSGTTASNITWTTNGITDPGNLTVVNITQGAGDGNLFDFAANQGHFAPANNVGNGGEWEVPITFTTLGDPIELTDVVWEYTNFGNTGNVQGVARENGLTVSIEGPGGALLAPVENSLDAITGSLIFVTPVTLDANTEYTITFNADGIEPGSNTSIDALTVNGEVVPEPTSLALLGLGGLLAARRRNDRI